MTAKDTKHVKDHRQLHFDNVDELIAEVDRITSAEQEGRLQRLGNWTPGQILSHLAAWIEYAYEGFPTGKPPFFIRWILKLQLKKMLRDGMPRGVKIPRVDGGTTGLDDAPTEEAAQRYKIALQRLVSDEPTKHDSPAFGPLSEEDRVQLNLRHAELHLGFLKYD